MRASPVEEGEKMRRNKEVLDYILHLLELRYEELEKLTWLSSKRLSIPVEKINDDNLREMKLNKATADYISRTIRGTHECELAERVIE